MPTWAGPGPLGFAVTEDERVIIGPRELVADERPRSCRLVLPEARGIAYGIYCPFMTEAVDMTSTITDFARPLLDEIPPSNEDELQKFFDLVIEIWNMWVASAPPWNDSRALDELHERMVADELRPAELYVHRILGERWASRFSTDGRLVVDTLIKREDDAVVFHCFGCTATPELLETFRGNPS